jgi:hypothetical protein
MPHLSLPNQQPQKTILDSTLRIYPSNFVNEVAFLATFLVGRHWSTISIVSRGCTHGHSSHRVLSCVLSIIKYVIVWLIEIVFKNRRMSYCLVTRLSQHNLIIVLVCDGLCCRNVSLFMSYNKMIYYIVLSYLQVGILIVNAYLFIYRGLQKDG